MRRRLQRAKRAYFWLGTQGTIAVGTTVTLLELYDPAFASIADSKSLRFERLVGNMTLGQTTATSTSIGFSLQTLRTDASLAETNILDPLTNDADIFNKKQVLWGARFAPPILGQSQILLPIDIRSRRNMDAAQDMLAMVVVGNSGVNTTQVVYWLRALFSKPA